MARVEKTRRPLFGLGICLALRQLYYFGAGPLLLAAGGGYGGRKID